MQINEVIKNMYFDRIKLFDKAYLRKETEQHWSIVHNVSVDLFIEHNIEISNYHIDDDFVYFQLAKNKDRIFYIKTDREEDDIYDIKINYDKRLRKLERICK